MSRLDYSLSIYGTKGVTEDQVNGHFESVNKVIISDKFINVTENSCLLLAMFFFMNYNSICLKTSIPDNGPVWKDHETFKRWAEGLTSWGLFFKAIYPDSISCLLLPECSAVVQLFNPATIHLLPVITSLQP